MQGLTRREGLVGLAALAAAGAPPARAADGPVVDIPLDEVRSRYFLEVAINGQGGFRFVLDTGAPSHIVSQRVADRLALPTVSRSMVRRFDGRSPAAVVEMATLQAGGVSLGRSRAATWPDDRLEGHDGLIGYPYLAPRAVLSLGARVLSLGARGEVEGVPVRAEVDGREAVLVGGPPGAEGRFAFDTGAQDFTVSAAYHERLKATSAYRAAPKLVQRDAAGDERVLAFRLAAMTFGAFTVSAPVVRVGPADGREGAFDGVDGLMGVGLLRRYVWAIDPEAGRLRVLGEVAIPGARAPG